MEIDPRFKQAKARAAQRRRNAWAVPLVIWGGGVLALGLVAAALYFGGILTIGQQVAEKEPQAPAAAEGAAYASPFVDIPGDPMVLRFDTSGATKTRDVLRPVDIPASRAGTDVSVLDDDLISGQETLMTTLPSSREDFAYLQLQQSAAPMAPQQVAVAGAPTAGADDRTVVVAGDTTALGASLDGKDQGPLTFERTTVANTTSVALVRPSTTRQPLYRDTTLRLTDKTDLASLLTKAKVDADAATAFAEAAAALVPAFGALEPGHIVAMRAMDAGGALVPVQAALYTKDGYIGSVAVNDAGQVVASADPWVLDDLFNFAGDTQDEGVDVSRKYRMLDAFYSAAIRNAVPSDVVTEAIVMLSKSFDLDSFAAPGDKMTLIYSKDPGSDGPGAGQVLYAAIKGNGKDLQCHVFKLPTASDYACFKAGSAGGGGGVSLRPGFVAPTQGVITAGFGPQMDPVLKRVLQNNGVDWAAPIGTPVVAAFAGTVLTAGDAGDQGTMVSLSHEGGLETRYAHLNALAAGIAAGGAVTAGQVIGFVGSTGISTGPHLHFELYEAGVAVDPFLGGAGSDGSAVEQMVDQIIRVESGGNAAAANPLSTAVGLGQFIESTWLRMMAQYRPDLASTMDRAALLALRTDPTLSREMITALAREGESYLRARGHDITAGRLYLCHFLGAEGANVVLSAQDDQLVLDVMGAGVVNANPFLNGMTIAGVKDWAERKMSGKGGKGQQDYIPAEVLAYQKIIADILASAPI